MPNNTSATVPSTTKSSIVSSANKSTPLKKVTTNTTAKSTVRTGSKPTTPNKSIIPSTVHIDEINRLTITLETMQKERDFYFGKLREIEILCQSDDVEPLIQQRNKEILDILYHSDEPEFQSPVDDNNDDIVNQNRDDINHSTIQDENKQQDDGLLAL